MNTTRNAPSQYNEMQYKQPEYGQNQSPPSSQPHNLTHQTKFCKYCGGEMPNYARFCSVCGANEFNN